MKAVQESSGLTQAQIAQLDALDSDPDLTEFPELADEQWATARRGVIARAMCDGIAVEIDGDVLEWVRAQGPAYRTTINRILRERMEAEATAGR